MKKLMRKMGQHALTAVVVMTCWAWFPVLFVFMVISIFYREMHEKIWSVPASARDRLGERDAL